MTPDTIAFATIGACILWSVLCAMRNRLIQFPRWRNTCVNAASSPQLLGHAMGTRALNQTTAMLPTPLLVSHRGILNHYTRPNLCPNRNRRAGQLRGWMAYHRTVRRMA